MQYGLYEGRKNLGIVLAPLFRASGCRCFRGLRDPDRLRAFATLNVRYVTDKLIGPPYSAGLFVPANRRSISLLSSIGAS